MLIHAPAEPEKWRWLDRFRATTCAVWQAWRQVRDDGCLEILTCDKTNPATRLRTVVLLDGDVVVQTSTLNIPESMETRHRADVAAALTGMRTALNAWRVAAATMIIGFVGAIEAWLILSNEGGSAANSLEAFLGRATVAVFGSDLGVDLPSATSKIAAALIYPAAALLAFTLIRFALRLLARQYAGKLLGDLT